MTIPLVAAKAAPIHFLLLDHFPIFEQLRLEEALLRADERNWCLINIGSPPAIVLGISGKPEFLINQHRFSKKPVPVIRRFSGGGTVFVDQDTIFMTWICNAEHVGRPCCPSAVHQWMEDFYCAALPIGMCLREFDYVIGERKFGGNAQYFCKQRWLHHSSLLWDYNAANMDYLLMPQKTPQYRKLRSHHEFLCRLRDFFGEKDEVTKHFLTALHQRFIVQEVAVENALKVTECQHRKATHWVEFS